MENLNIRNMQLSDLDEISDIYEKDFENLWKINILKSELTNESSQYIVARINNEIVGFAGIWLSVDDAHITNIVVKKNYRHMGIGSKLLEKLITMAKNSHKSCLTLEVNTKNVYAEKLYLKYGFKNLGIRKKYYNGIEDALIMTLYF